MAVPGLLISFGIVVSFAILGKAIFHLFGITLPALRITGDTLVFQVGFFGQRSLTIVTRLMGLILAVMGTQMILHGLSGTIAAYLVKWFTPGKEPVSLTTIQLIL